MKISTLEEYALRCLSQLAREGAKLTIGRIAQAEGLSEENTAKVLARLRSLGFVRSVRGKEGGYLLARPAREVSVAEVIRSVSGSLFELERCQGAAGSDGCVHLTDCGLRPMWTSLESLVQDFLSSLSIADLVRDETSVTARVGALLQVIDRSPAATQTGAAETG